MNETMTILFICIGVIVGFIFGIVIASVKRHRKNVVGILQIVKEEGEPSPYIFLQINKPEFISLTDQKYVYLRVQRMQHKDDVDSSKKTSSQK